jgi:hypothetical protein
VNFVKQSGLVYRIMIVERPASVAFVERSGTNVHWMHLFGSS